MKGQQNSKSLQFELQLFDNNHQETFNQKFYTREDQDYTEVLKKIADILKAQNIDVYLNELSTIIITGGRIQSERFIVIKKVD